MKTSVKTCTATCIDGRSCTARARSGRPFCFAHDPDLQSRRAAGPQFYPVISVGKRSHLGLDCPAGRARQVRAFTHGYLPRRYLKLYHTGRIEIRSSRQVGAPLDRLVEHGRGAAGAGKSRVAGSTDPDSRAWCIIRRHRLIATNCIRI